MLTCCWLPHIKMCVLCDHLCFQICWWMIIRVDLLTMHCSETQRLGRFAAYQSCLWRDSDIFRQCKQILATVIIVLPVPQMDQYLGAFVCVCGVRIYRKLCYVFSLKLSSHISHITMSHGIAHTTIWAQAGNICFQCIPCFVIISWNRNYESSNRYKWKELSYYVWKQNVTL